MSSLRWTDEGCRAVKQNKSVPASGGRAGCPGLAQPPGPWTHESTGPSGDKGHMIDPPSALMAHHWEKRYSDLGVSL